MERLKLKDEQYINTIGIHRAEIIEGLLRNLTTLLLIDEVSEPRLLSETELDNFLQQSNQIECIIQKSKRDLKNANIKLKNEKKQTAEA